MNISQNQQGSSLIETMVALFVLAIGVLGVLSMQVKAVQFSNNSHLYSQAAFLANDIYEGMQATPELADTYIIFFDDDTPNKPDCGAGKDCSEENIVNWNIYNWRSNIESLLPGGKSEIDRVNDQLVIRVEYEMGYASDGTPETQEYLMITDF